MSTDNNLKHVSQIDTSQLEAEVTRTDTGTLHITWTALETARAISIYQHTSPEHIESQGQKLAHLVPGETSLLFDHPMPTGRPYFRIVTENGTGVTVAERRVPLQGVGNFRDLGGYRANDGRRVKWGQLFRSDELAELTKDDIQYLQTMGLRFIYDYRTDTEAELKPDPQIEGVEYLRTSALQFDARVGNMDMSQLLNPDTAAQIGDPQQLLIQANRDFVSENAAFTQFLRKTMDAQNRPIVNHCTAGKDRTGFGSALLLLALGIPEQTVFDDYLVTNRYRQEANQKILGLVKRFGITDARVLNSITILLEARLEYLTAALEKIKEQYGSYNRYFEEGMGFTPEEILDLQDQLLEK